MKLSTHFSLQEFLHSESAVRLGIPMTPSFEEVDNLRALCTNVLEPLRVKTGGPLVITSGYRPRRLNKAIGGAKHSAHIHGCAADVQSLTISPYELAELAVGMKLPFDQVIHEFGRWVHLGIACPGELPRLQCLTAVKDAKPFIGKPKTRYIKGVVAVGKANARLA